MVTGVNIRGDTKINSSFVALQDENPSQQRKWIVLVSLAQHLDCA